MSDHLTASRVARAYGELGVFDFVGYDFEGQGEWQEHADPERLEMRISVSADDQESEGLTEYALFTVFFENGTDDVADVKAILDGHGIGARGDYQPPQPGMLW